eukprot:TRINITY_DN3638_c0_g1_i1.p1 TRINITY_DN3638_c0_g1~~TRINITY_DN3638_c0_g1_i1.p1  ORF type:complete len:618 (-),score=133.99 TRINITY_DN3638_c0_g1_i1:261-2114(-)
METPPSSPYYLSSEEESDAADDENSSLSSSSSYEEDASSGEEGLTPKQRAAERLRFMMAKRSTAQQQGPPPRIAPLPTHSRFKAFRFKMKLLGLFVGVNVLFVLLVQMLDARYTSFIFFAYIVLSALPKFIFGSLLFWLRPCFSRLCRRKNRRNKGNSWWRCASRRPAPIDPESTWHISADPVLCKSCGEDRTGFAVCPNCEKNYDDLIEHPKLVSACVTVHHEDGEGLAAGVTSFEDTELPFARSLCQLVYIIDGRYTGSGKYDTIQERTTRSLLLRLYGGRRNSLPEQCVQLSAAYDNSLVLVDPADPSRSVHPHMLPDKTAVYTGKLSGDLPFFVLLKQQNQGKRHSHKLFFEYMQDEIIFKTARAIMFVDSDVVFTHNGDNKGMGKLYKYLTSDPDLGGAAGEIEVWRWTKNPVTITQYFEYKSNQFMAKTFENWFGMVTCLPGAFCMVRPQALEHVLSCYLQDANTIVEKNQLDLGEDRTMTTLLLQAGWRTGYLTSATALTDVPQTLPQLIRQRRRWINSTVVNMWLLLRHVNRWCSAFPLLVSLGVELISSFTLPTAVLMLFFQMGASVGLNALLVIAVIILPRALLVRGVGRRRRRRHLPDDSVHRPEC